MCVCVSSLAAQLPRGPGTRWASPKRQSWPGWPGRSWPRPAGSGGSPPQAPRRPEAMRPANTARQADRQAGRQADRQTDRHTGRRPDTPKLFPKMSTLPFTCTLATPFSSTPASPTPPTPQAKESSSAPTPTPRLCFGHQRPVGPAPRAAPLPCHQRLRQGVQHIPAVQAQAALRLETGWPEGI